MAARDAILYQTSNNKLRKKILAEDQALDKVVKLGLAYEQSSSKAEAMDKSEDNDKSVQKAGGGGDSKAPVEDSRGEGGDRQVSNLSQGLSL